MPLVRYRHDFQIDEAIDAAVVASGGGDMLAANNLSDLANAATARTNLGVAIGSDVQAYDADLATWAGLTPSANAQSLITAANYAAMRGLLDLEAGTDFYSIAAADAAFLSQAEGDAAYQPLDAELTTWAGLTPSANAQSLVTAANYAAMRTLLDLEAGTDFYSISAADAAFQPKDAGLTDIAALAVTDGNIIVGDGANWVAESGATARASLGLTIGTHVQAYDADLTTWAGLTPSANAQSLVTAANYAAMRGLLDLEAGTDFYSIAAADAAFQPKDADLTALAGLVSAADKVPYFTGAGTAAVADFTAYGRTLVALADETALEAVLDTLPNLTSIQGRTVTLADAGADALLGWDDSASAYQNLSAADARTALGLATTDSPQFTAINVGAASDTTIARVSAGVISVEGSTIWTAGNDGAGSGLDADLLDGKNIGTSGNTVPLLDGTNTWSGVQTFGNTGVVVGASTPFSDSAGTLTLQNVDALDATTEATIEAAIDTLANLTSIQGRTVTLADAGANAIFGWDDTAGAYENLSAAEATAVLSAFVGDAGAGGTKGLVPAPSTGDSGKYLKGDGTWTAIPGGGDLLASNNLSDLANAATARTNLGVAIGTNVQAYDADLTTWAGITPGANVGTFLATPSSANLAAALTDETGTGAAVFGTGPTLSSTTAATTPYTSKNTADGASVAVAVFEGDRATPAANDEIYASFVISDSAGNQDENARITAKATTVTSGAGQAGRLQFGVRTANTLADELYLTGAELSPATSDGLALGSTSLMFSDLFLASLGVINFNAGNFTLTHSDGNITASGTVSIGNTDTALSRASAGRLAVAGTTLGITIATEQASTSGTSIDFTSIPSWAKRITIMFEGVSTSGTSNPLIQIGDSGGIEPSGYLGSGMFITNAADEAGAANYTTGYGIFSAAAATVLHGSVVLTLMNASSNKWIANGVLAASNTTAGFSVAGSKSLTGTLDRVRITTVGGADTFDAGNLNIMYDG